ncbi:Eco57I restriction-modification methylase domain-containing protein [Phormidesmis priestleyi]
MQFDFKKSRQYLQEFAFGDLFREVLGWSKPTIRRAEELEVDGQLYDRLMIAELSGVAVYEVTAHDGAIAAEKVRSRIYQQTAEISLENLLIFVDRDRTQSFWYWVKREDNKRIPRSLSYFKWQSGDLILGKISALMVDFEELGDEAPSVVLVAKKLKDALDVERVTKKFYKEFKEHLEWFVEQIKGVDHENDRRWYASVILNRLMFVYFLQYKGFVDGNQNYLQDKLAQHQGKDFYKAFLCLLFFEGFAKASPNRSPEAVELLGNIKYLNGGLFLEHRIEKENTIAIANEAFEKTLALFQRYSWNLDDSPGGQDDEISPSVLGYIFEKYINQKEFGAYYTRPEITEYLCDRTINKLILDKVNVESKRRFDSIGELIPRLDASLCHKLLTEILPGLSLLDPACGSGAFLVAAMKTLINVYVGVFWRIEFLNDRRLTDLIKKIRAEHPSTAYYIRKRIITDNLYGVDIMEEATEITKLRLFLALVATAQSLEELEPLPNIDFNVMAGNSLIGLIGVDGERFDAVAETRKQRERKAQQARWGQEAAQTDLSQETYFQVHLLQPDAVMTYRQILDEKNQRIRRFKNQAFRADDSTEPKSETGTLKEEIETQNNESQTRLNRLLFDEFGQIKFEQAQATGKPKKRLLEMKDIDRLEPFHWGYHFDQIINERGGFDAIIANPPWEVFKPDAKEFFQKYSDLVTKKKMDIKAFEKHQTELLEDPEVAAAWLQYQSQFPYVSTYYRSSENYKNQISVVNGKKAGTDINLYKLFLERCFSLLKSGGECGIVIPSGLYTDLGSKQLREMLFSETQITGLFCFENRKEIFEGVHRSFKFIVLSFCKGTQTESFPAAFMRHDVRELTDFPSLNSLQISVELIRQLSPDSISVMEFKSDLDITIANKMFQHPKLGEQLADTWNLKLGAEFHMTNDSHLFKQQFVEGRLPLYEGKMMNQFTHLASEPRYWLDEAEARKSLLGRTEDEGQILN